MAETPECITRAAAAAPYFCGVALDRLAGERDDEAAMAALAADAHAVTLLYSPPATGARVCLAPSSGTPVRVPLRTALALPSADAASATFLGLDRTASPPVPVFAVLCSEDEVVDKEEAVTQASMVPPGSVFVDALGATLCGGARALDRAGAALAGYGRLMVRQHVHGSGGARHCAACGAATVARAAGTRRHCAACARDVFPRTDPVAIVLVVDAAPGARRTLLVRKPQYVPRTRHTCVAGFVEPGESAEEAAAREVKEETGVDVDRASVRFVASQPWPSGLGSQLMLGFMCRARADSAPVRADPAELDDARWYSVDEVRAALAAPDPTADPHFSVPGPWALAHTMLARWVQQMDAGTLQWD